MLAKRIFATCMVASCRSHCLVCLLFPSPFPALSLPSALRVMLLPVYSALRSLASSSPQLVLARAAMAPGRCLCGGWYQGNGHCSNGVDRIDGRHKGPGWVKRHCHELTLEEEARWAGWQMEEDDPTPPASAGEHASSAPAPAVGPISPAPVAQAPVRPVQPLVVTCRQRTQWLATCARDGRVSTAPACRQHLIQLFSGEAVDVLSVRCLAPKRSRSADAADRLILGP